MSIDLSNLHAGPCEAADILNQAAAEFDRRAMLPTIHPGYERTRILCCAEWLRDMAKELRDRAAEMG